MAYNHVMLLSAFVCISAVFHHPMLNTSGLELVEDVKNASRRLTDVVNSRGQRIVNQVAIVNQAVTAATIAVDSQTSLYVQTGQTATLYFDVTNNNNWNAFFYFYCSTVTSTLLSIQPNERWIAGLDTTTVKVVLRTSDSSTSTETITFSAVTYSSSGDDPTSVKAFLYVGQQQVSDSNSPAVSYSINGDCSGASTPSTCSAKTWGLSATIQDSNSGLLSVVTVPVGFVFTTDFTAGTKNQVSGRYSNSCCVNKVDLVATDLNGNQYMTSIDINNVWLSVGAISAIVLACILLLLLIILICCAIAFCIRRRRKTKTFTMHS